LHGADSRMFARIDHQGTRGADRVGMAGAPPASLAEAEVR
jgi:hypothetical protein